MPKDTFFIMCRPLSLFAGFLLATSLIALDVSTAASTPYRTLLGTDDGDAFTLDVPAWLGHTVRPIEKAVRAW